MEILNFERETARFRAEKERLWTSCYNGFELTGALRPAYDDAVLPVEGYRVSSVCDPSGHRFEQLVATLSQGSLFETFLSFLDLLGPVVDLVLETSHQPWRAGVVESCRQGMDLTVLKSILCDFETLLLDDGCTGIAVYQPELKREVRWDEHKILTVYGEDLTECEALVIRRGIPFRRELPLLTQGEHIHLTTSDFRRQAEELRVRLGMDFNRVY